MQPGASDVESQALVGRAFGRVKTYGTDADKVLGKGEQQMYSARAMPTFAAFYMSEATIWASPQLWKMMGHLSCVALVVAIITSFVMPNPKSLKASRFTDVSKFLNVIVGLLLGFFISAAMDRWYKCVSGFLELLDATRNLQMQFIALGVEEHEVSRCLRYARLSAWLLHGSLQIQAKGHGTPEGAAIEEQMWQMLTRNGDRTQNLTAQLVEDSILLEVSEAAALRTTRDPASMMWVFASSYIGRLAQDGSIPPMASPTYGRIMNLIQTAHFGIRTVRASSLQVPFIYAQVLASIVHVNNLINAVTFGIVLGLWSGMWLQSQGIHLFGHLVDQEYERCGQNTFVTFLYCFFGPLLWQGLLIISMNLDQPFDTDGATPPLLPLLRQLEHDLRDGRMILKHVPWEQASFKLPPPISPKHLQKDDAEDADDGE